MQCDGMGSRPPVAWVSRADCIALYVGDPSRRTRARFSSALQVIGGQDSEMRGTVTGVHRNLDADGVPGAYEKAGLFWRQGHCFCWLPCQGNDDSGALQVKTLGMRIVGECWRIRCLLLSSLLSLLDMMRRRCDGHLT
ncbi:hypothetical protein LIA77_02259 [Sarocladium implicatum]|nr:hypothetical protein LIA77_02259 [Sarocladium implicatum]